MDAVSPMGGQAKEVYGGNGKRAWLGAPGESKPYAGELDFETVEQKLISVLEAGHAVAVGLSQGRHRKMAQYRLMRDARWKGDSKDDPLVNIGWYTPLLSRLIDVSIALELRELIPDPQSMDFIQAYAKWTGGGEYSEKITSSLQENAKRMIPEEAPGGLLEVMASLLDDRRTLGTCCAYVNHDALLDKGIIVSDAATVQYVDPANVNPWQIDTLNPTGFSIYAPLSEEELDQLDLPEEIGDRLREALTGGETVAERDPQSEGSGQDGGEDSIGTGRQGSIGGGHEGTLTRTRYLGLWPGAALRRAFGGRIGGAPGKEQIIGVLAEYFRGQKKATRGAARETNQANRQDIEQWIETAGGAKWWLLEWHDKILIRAEPFPLDLPTAFQPLEFSRYHKRNGRFWGDSMYDRGQFDERGVNLYNRVLVTLGLFMANPPFTLDTTGIKTEWLQEQGNNPRLVPGMYIPLIKEMAKDPWHAFVPGSEFVPAIGTQLERHKESAREMVGVESPLTGGIKGRTMGQQQMAIQQQMTTVQFDIEQARMFLNKLMIRAYVVKSQAMKIHGQSEWVPSCEADRELSMIRIKPEDLVHLALVDIRCVGNSTPGSRQQQLQALIEGAKLFMQAGNLDQNEFAKRYWKLAQVQNPEKLVKIWTPQEVQRMVLFLKEHFGPQAMTMLPPAIQQMMSQMMGQGQMPSLTPSNPLALPGPGGAPSAGGPAMPGPGSLGGGAPEAGNTPSAPRMPEASVIGG